MVSSWTQRSSIEHFGVRSYLWRICRCRTFLWIYQENSGNSFSNKFVFDDCNRTFIFHFRLEFATFVFSMSLILPIIMIGVGKNRWKQKKNDSILRVFFQDSRISKNVHWIEIFPCSYLLAVQLHFWNYFKFFGDITIAVMNQPKKKRQIRTMVQLSILNKSFRFVFHLINLI